MPIDINNYAGKGARPHRNVSTTSYREGWRRVFARKVPAAFPAEPEGFSIGTPAALLAIAEYYIPRENFAAYRAACQDYRDAMKKGKL